MRRLSDWQIDTDRFRTRMFPELMRRKSERMCRSPLAFLRGAAPLFYLLLASIPELEAGPAGEGWLVGDAHLENFGAFQVERRSEEENGKREVVFDLNDFDEAVVGPLRWDVMRLTTSLVLGARELGIDGPSVLRLCERLIAHYVETSLRGAPLPQVPAPVSALLERARTRSKKDLLEARSSGNGRERRLIRSEGYRELPPEIAARVPTTLLQYAGTLSAEEQPKQEQLQVMDVAHRVAGTGSLGCLRIAALTRGKSEGDGAWLFDLKEQVEPSALLVSNAARDAAPRPSPLDASGLAERPAQRVLRASKACLSRPPRMLGFAELEGRSMLIRRLTPQEDKLELARLRSAELPELSAYLGAVLGAAHARGRMQATPAAWSCAEQRELLERAVLCAGLHEACYLEFCLTAHPSRS
ncbi:MAG TPA: DUF2252 family protein [Polyangiaceae bacterium]|nr:DUF2252 family protein [Polyangiaceae bacterium]